MSTATLKPFTSWEQSLLPSTGPHFKQYSENPLPEYVPPPPTKENLEWAVLPIVDFAKADTLEGRRALAKEVVDAMNDEGFFYIINHGYTIEQTRRIFSLANITFDNVDSEEKQKYRQVSPAVYGGYKPRHTWKIEDDVTDEIEHYNMNRHIHRFTHPTVLRPHLDEIEKFGRHNHTHVLYILLRLMALGMDLPEETFVNLHAYDDPGESSVRFLKYYPRSAEKTNVYLKGHTDTASITLLWSQPIAGLQILSKDRVWRHIKHIEGSLIVNSGDAMRLLSGGFYEPTIHRVIQAPKDQVTLERPIVFYSAMAADHVKLASVKGDVSGSEEVAAPMMSDWRQERSAKYGSGSMQVSLDEEKVEQEVILGVTVKEYN